MTAASKVITAFLEQKVTIAVASIVREHDGERIFQSGGTRVYQFPDRSLLIVCGQGRSHVMQELPS